MEKDLYTITQKKYMQSENIEDLEKILADQIVGQVAITLKNLDIYKNKKSGGFLSSLFNKSDKENNVCKNFSIRAIAIIINSFRNILYDSVHKHVADSIFKNVVNNIGEKLPKEVNISVKNSSDFSTEIYREITNYNHPKTNDSQKKDFQYLLEVNTTRFSQKELMQIQKLVNDGWVILYPHTFVAQFKKYYNQIN